MRISFVLTFVLFVSLIFSSCASSGQPIDGYPNLRISYDEFQGFSTINSTKNFAADPIIGGVRNIGGSLNPHSAIVPFIRIRENSVSFNLQVRFSYTRWLFMDRVVFLSSSGDRFTISLTNVNRETHRNTGSIAPSVSISETAYYNVTREINSFRKVLEGTENVRFMMYGSTYSHEFVMVRSVADSILEMIDYYILTYVSNSSVLEDLGEEF